MLENLSDFRHPQKLIFFGMLEKDNYIIYVSDKFSFFQHAWKHSFRHPKISMKFLESQK